ncbi:MAG: hypothetical protein IH586_08505, partial [Anaerolineaceae bacterium]|nr:hypothetical protein [Anaerolineaceae bacterium]
ALKKTILVEMGKAGLGNCVLAESAQSQTDQPVVLVSVGKPRMIWTPFFAQSQFAIRAGYASNGDTTFMNESPTIINNNGGSIVDMTAEFQVNDQSWGIISRPGYDQILADWLAKGISEAVKNLYEGKNIFPPE